MNSGQTRTRLVQAGAAFMAVALIVGCGNTYRSVITSSATSTTASQVTSYLAAVSVSSSKSAGIATLIDYSGDSIMATAQLGNGPLGFILDQTGSTGYTWNTDKSLNTFSMSNSSLLTKNVTNSTLESCASSSSSTIYTDFDFATGCASYTTGFYASGGSLWGADLQNNTVDIYTSSPPTFSQAVSVAATPIQVIGASSSATTYYAISQNNVTSSALVDGVNNETECNSSPQSISATSTGVVTPIETSTHTADTPITVGVCPVFAVMNSTGTRLFVLNRGSDTISVIDTTKKDQDKCTPFKNQANQLVTCHPTIPLTTAAATAAGVTTQPTSSTNLSAFTIAGPVYAEYNIATQQLVVANYDGSMVSIVDVSMDEYGNDANAYAADGTTPVSGFGTVYNVAVGANPAAVTVLYDGSRAYTANQTDQNVSVVDLSSHTVLGKTLPVDGHPRSIVSTQNSETAKVYVSSPDSNNITVINAVTDLVDTTVGPLSGSHVIDIHTTTQNGSSGNDNPVSRAPGYGQPCYMPGSSYTASLGTCQTLPTSN